MQNKSRGFTLIELLVTMTIIGALMTIAIPQYQEYRKRGFDLRAQSDLRNIAIAEEAYFLDWERYLSCGGSTCAGLPGIQALSPGVTLQVTATATGFTGTATHPRGTGKVFAWDTALGGFQE